MGYLGIDCGGLHEYNFQSHYFDVDVRYTALLWLIPLIQAVYRSNGGGYYIEIELRGHWDTVDQLTIEAYAKQAFDLNCNTKTIIDVTIMRLELNLTN